MTARYATAGGPVLSRRTGPSAYSGVVTTMTCIATPASTEMDFVHTLIDRKDSEQQCRGPLLTLTLGHLRPLELITIFDSRMASDLFASGHGEDPEIFTLCAAHWFDLAALVWVRSNQTRRQDFFEAAEQLLRDVCWEARWDLREVMNMFHWQSIRLT